MARNSGKYLEDIVQDELKKLVSGEFIFRRLYDAFSAQGTGLPAQPADFECAVKSHGAFYLECKSVGHKKGRLPKGSFSQLADMKAWSRCSVSGVLLVHCYGFDSNMYLVNVDDIDQSLKSWVIPDIGKQVLTTNLLEGIIKLL